jgi:hypothetical protein
VEAGGEMSEGGDVEGNVGDVEGDVEGDVMANGGCKTRMKLA